jgi:hypothetical protein
VVAKKSVGQFTGPVGLDFHTKYFSQADVRDIAEAADLVLKKRQARALKRALQAQAQWYFGVSKPDETRPTSRQVNNALKEIEGAADRLLSRLFLSGEKNFEPTDVPYAILQRLETAAAPEAQSYGNLGRTEIPAKFGRELVTEAIIAVRKLRDWARASTSQLSSATVNDLKRHMGEEALNELVKGLVEEVWQGKLGQAVTTTYDSSKLRKGAQAGSPTVRFVSAVLDKLQVNDKDGDGYSYDAIRARMQRLGL